MTWREAHKLLHRMRENDEEFSTRRDVAAKLGCSSATVQKALDRDAALKSWADGEPENNRARFHQWSEDGREEHAPSQGTDPAQAVLENEDEEFDLMWSKLLQQSDPEERARFNAMCLDERRRMLEVISEDPAWRKRLKGLR